jgi:hypothetical protein
MNKTHRIPAKAIDPESRSDAIVVSFGCEWYESLRAGRFSAVIRKRVPASVQPRWLYFHINSPRSAICARAEIRSVEILGIADVLQLRHELDLSEEQILMYFGGQASMGCYRLGRIMCPSSDVASQKINTHMVYHAPQSFFVLSRDAKDLLDRICGFTDDDVLPGEASRT